MPKFEHHIFVCCNTRAPDHPRGCCNPDSSGRLRECFKAELRRHNLVPQVRANQCGCLDQCELGPTVVIYPQAIWYGGVTPDDVARIVAETIQHGRVLDDLLIPDHQLNARKLKGS